MYDVSEIAYDDSLGLKEWDIFVDISPQGSIFCKSWWLDIVRPEGYRILLLRKHDKIVAGMPLCSYYDEEGRYIHNMPVLTQTLGILLEPREGKYYKKLSTEMDMIQMIVDNIPEHKWFYMQFGFNFTNWLPFYWAGYLQSTRYTYVFHDISDLNEVYNNFNYSKRKNIEKAKNIVEIRTDLSAMEFREIQKTALVKDNKMLSISIAGCFETFKKLYDTVGKSWYAIDNKGNIHSAIYVVYDKISAYYLCSCVDREFRKYGANTLLIWNAIKELSGKTQRFDFEGSMIRGVEESFRQFGAKQTPYFVITKGGR